MSELAPFIPESTTSAPASAPAIAARTHRGHGPRDWRRSDEQIRDAVCEALAADGELDARDMNVGVDAGEVVLSGVCPCRQSRALAEAIAREVVGVRAVHNFVGIRTS